MRLRMHLEGKIKNWKQKWQVGQTNYANMSWNLAYINSTFRNRFPKEKWKYNKVRNSMTQL